MRNLIIFAIFCLATTINVSADNIRFVLDGTYVMKDSVNDGNDVMLAIKTKDAKSFTATINSSKTQHPPLKIYNILSKSISRQGSHKLTRKNADSFKQFEDFILNNIIPSKLLFPLSAKSYKPLKFQSENLAKSIPVLKLSKQDQSIILTGVNDKSIFTSKDMPKATVNFTATMRIKNNIALIDKISIKFTMKMGLFSGTRNITFERITKKVNR